MDRIEAQIAAEGILGEALATQIDVETWERALDASVTVDPGGRLPGHEDWEPTYDPYWVGAEGLTALAIRAAAAGGGLRKFTAEGASFETDAPDLWGVAATLRARSAIGKARAVALGLLEVDGRLSHYQPASGGRPDLSVLPNGAIMPAHLDWT